MEVNNLFGHVNSIADKIATNWNYFSGVSLGIVAAVALKEDKISCYVGIALFLSLLLFYWSNHYRISRLTDEIHVAEKELGVNLENNKEFTEEFINFYKNGYSRVNELWHLFHIAISVAVLVLILFRIDYKPCC